MADEEDHTDDIAALVAEGYREGYHPRWILELDERLHEDDVVIEQVARLIRQGYTEGYGPRWRLKVP